MLLNIYVKSIIRAAVINAKGHYAHLFARLFWFTLVFLTEKGISNKQKLES